MSIIFFRGQTLFLLEVHMMDSATTKYSPLTWWFGKGIAPAKNQLNSGLGITYIYTPPAKYRFKLIPPLGRVLGGESWGYDNLPR